MSKNKDIFSDLIENIKSMIGGAALALATKDAAEEGRKLSLSNVNEWAKTLNAVAGGLIIAYVITIAALGLAVHYSDKHAFAVVFSHMTAEEIADYQDRLNTGRSVPLLKDSESIKCVDAGKNKSK